MTTDGLINTTSSAASQVMRVRSGSFKQEGCMNAISLDASDDHFVIGSEHEGCTDSELPLALLNFALHIGEDNNTEHPESTQGERITFQGKSGQPLGLSTASKSGLASGEGGCFHDCSTFSGISGVLGRPRAKNHKPSKRLTVHENRIRHFAGKMCPTNGCENKRHPCTKSSIGILKTTLHSRDEKENIPPSHWLPFSVDM
ncbi:hypothetical protein B0H11DRAFT_1958078 [Mycena galericulata]|nr:hypothetical protein B0H11DRAFT_1958078 [Mycena galericulata]